MHKGHKPGVYTSWADAQNTIADFKGAVYKSFKTREEAQAFFKNGHPPKRASEEPSQPSPPAKKQKATKSHITPHTVSVILTPYTQRSGEC